jgi:drug/metabolite transporter (DMT)-like permease
VVALLALVAVTAVWGVTFVQVKDAIELYPLFAFLAVRFGIATLTLAPVAWRRVTTLGRSGTAASASLGLLLALGYALQTAGLERTTVSATGFITGLYVVLTPVFGLVLFRLRIGAAGWTGAAVATVGLAMLSGVEAGSAAGDLLVLGCAASFALQIVLMGRYAPRFDPLALTFVEMTAALVGFVVVALALGQVELPRGGTVWGALLVTGVFASALAFLVQSWAQQRTTAMQTAPRRSPASQ